jgi:hypothetical protein
MGKCAFSDGTTDCGRDTVAMSKFCSVHAQLGKPESVITPDPSGGDKGAKHRINEGTIHYAPDIDHSKKVL